MPVQALIRKLTRAQVDKAVTDSKAKLTIQDAGGGASLVIVTASMDGEGKDPAANLALQKICDMDAAIVQKEHEEATAKLAEERAAKLAADAAKANG
jgi:hypothetical protein